MATTRTVFVDTDAAGGGDGSSGSPYNDLDDAWVAEAGDITLATGSDEIVVFECSGSTPQFTFDISAETWQTGPGNYIVIRQAASDAHGGVYDDTKFRFVKSGTSGGYNISFSGGDAVAHVRLEGLQISNETTHSSGAIGIRFNAVFDDTSADFRVSGCLLRLDHQDGTDVLSSATISIGDSQPTYRIWNNTIYVASASQHDPSSTNIGIGNESSSGAAIVYNNDVIGFPGTGIDLNSASVAKNNRVENCGTAFGTVHADSDYNASDDASAPGPNSRINQVFTTEAGVDDHRITPSDAGAKDRGVDLSADPDLAFSDDIAGTVRPIDSVWDIGSFEAATDGGAGNPSSVLLHNSGLSGLSGIVR